MKLVISLLGVLFVGFVLFSLYSSANNEAVTMETNLVAAQQDSQNVLSAYTQKVMTAGQLPAKMRDDLKEVMEAAFEGRYGEDGSKAVFQMITENYPGQVDPQLYRNLQTMIESGRNDFAKAQTRVIDQRRVYEAKLRSVPAGWMMKLIGYPTLDLNDFNPVLDAHTNESFSTKEEKTLQLP